MNLPPPPRDRGRRRTTAGRQSGRSRPLPGAGGLVGGTQAAVAGGPEPEVNAATSDPLARANVQMARQCLALIRDIADRGASSWNPECVGYALQELSQVLMERTGNRERVFEPAPANEICGLAWLLRELDFVSVMAQDLTHGTFN